MRIVEAEVIWNDWRERARGQDPTEVLDQLIAETDSDAALVRSAAGALDVDSWMNFAPCFVGLTLGACDLPPHPLSRELADDRCEVLGYLFDPVTSTPSWEVITFLLGVAIARRRLDIDVVRTCFTPRGAICAEDKATLALLGATLQPTVALETGTFEGGTTAMLARMAERVVTIDWGQERAAHVAMLDNVTFVCGRASDEIGAVLAEHPETSLVFLDADHSRLGVADEVVAVLDAPTPAVRVIAIHDAAETECRAGLLSVQWDRPVVVRASFGMVSRHPDGNGFGGLGLVLTSCRGTSNIVRLDSPRTARWPCITLAAPEQPRKDAGSRWWRRRTVS